jgi:anti-sigma regulatory factor (Ser/Thr protein kinase)
VLILDSDVAGVERLGTWVAQFGQLHGLDPTTVNELNLALEEAVMNVIQYGRLEPREASIRLSLHAQDGEIVATVTDGGIAFNPLLAPEPDLSADLAERDLGGLGLHLARSVVTSMEYERRNGQNCLTLRKRWG